MSKRKAESGQALLELIAVLPVLLILLMSLVELGFALRNYLIVVNACREGCRFAARGRFGEEDVSDRVVSAGGRNNLGDFEYPFLRTATMDDVDPNTAIIVTNIRTNDLGEPITDTLPLVSGVVPDGSGNVRPVDVSDTKISVDQVLERHRAATLDVNAAREAAGYERMGNDIVIVEVLFMHHPLWRNFYARWAPDPWNMYARAEMRVVTDRESVD